MAGCYLYCTIGYTAVSYISGHGWHRYLLQSGLCLLWKCVGTVLVTILASLRTYLYHQVISALCTLLWFRWTPHLLRKHLIQNLLFCPISWKCYFRGIFLQWIFKLLQLRWTRWLLIELVFFCWGSIFKRIDQTFYFFL